jgi:hypothetical protein
LAFTNDAGGGVSFDNSNTASVIADKVRDGSSVTFFIDSVTELSTLTEGQSDWESLRLRQFDAPGATVA